jgi:hypothetical protein
MHTMILVIGEDPIGQLTRDGEAVRTNPAETITWTWQRSESEALRSLGSGDCGGADWFGIGGRYSGWLIPRPGAAGKRYGDTMPAFEASILTFAAGSAPDVHITRMGASGDRPGVDQIRASDVDWETTWHEKNRRPGVVVAHGEWHSALDVLTPEEHAATMASGLGIDAPDAEPAFRKLHTWDTGVLVPLVDAAVERGDLITVVDMHE